MQTILGINFVYHQSSACLVKAGKVIAACEEERFNRIKGAKEAHIDNTLILPFNSIDHVMSIAEISWENIDLIATSFNPKTRASYHREWSKYEPVLQGEYETDHGDQSFRAMIKLAPEVIAARYRLDSEWLVDRFKWVPHHIAHLASAFYASPFVEAAGMVFDGIGEFETTTLADCNANGITLLENVFYPNSLGFVWEVFTNFLGYEGNYDESKIMGLAAYGNPGVFRQAMKQVIFVDQAGDFETKVDTAILDGDYSSIENLFGLKRRLPYEPLAWQGRNRSHADLAATLQEVTNEVFIKKAKHVGKLTNRKYLVMAGGVCLNCVANGEVAEQAGFEDVYVQPATGDAGTSVGAALAVYHHKRTRIVQSAMPTPYLGPSYNNNEIRQVLEAFRLHYELVDDPVNVAADLLADGKIVGWFQGAMEFGPEPWEIVVYWPTLVWLVFAM